MQPDLLTTTPRRTNVEALGTSCALIKARRKHSLPDFRAVAAAALSNAEAVLARWLPDGKCEGHEYKARNPTRADNRPGSFSINTKTGKWSDFATGDKGGDLVSLVSYLDRCNQGEAAERLGHFLGLPGARLASNAPGQPGQPGQPTMARVSAAPAADGSTGAAGANGAELVAPVPDDAPAQPDSHPRRGRPSKIWIYPDADGRVLMLACTKAAAYRRSVGWRWLRSRTRNVGPGARCMRMNRAIKPVTENGVQFVVSTSNHAFHLAPEKALRSIWPKGRCRCRLLRR